MARYIQTKLFEDLSQLENALEREYEKVDAEETILDFRLKSFDGPVFDMVEKCIDKFVGLGYIPKIKIDFNNFDYTARDFENFINLEDYSKKQGLEIGFFEDNVEYSLDETLSAYVKCKGFAEYVKETNASPFEKYLMIYRYISSFVYSENEDKPKSSRRIISVMNSTDIVCVGYSKLLQYMCKEVGIFCETQHLDVYNEKTKKAGSHQNNIVYLKDEKYGIDGLYYADACWDSIKTRKEPFLQYNYALLPLSDAYKFRKKKIHIYSDTAALYDNDILEEMVVDNTICRKTAKKLGLNYNARVKIPAYFRDFRKEGNKLYDVSRVVEQMYKDAGIKSDFYNIDKYDAIPMVFYPEFLITLACVVPPQIQKIKEILSLMVKFQEQGYDALEDNYAISRHIHRYGYTHIYEEFETFRSGEMNINIWDMENYYENFEFLKEFTEVIDEIRASSVPISEDVFRTGIENSLLVEGYDEKHAGVQTKRSMSRSRRRAELIFNNDASNCFTRAALEKRGLLEK
ncbi:MAG: hypothetical protein J6J33_04575 [Clostridia bacterium]|nr:hypothetical protein [Clostridia bacterium]